MLFFGEPCHQRIARHTIASLDAKAHGILHGADVMRQRVEHFPTFSATIERKLAEEAYGGLLFNNFRIVGFVDCKIDPACRPGSGPAVDCQLAPRHEGHDILKESVFSGYAKCHGLKVLTVVFPNGLIGCLYGAVSARENDCGALNYSGLNAEIMRLQQLGHTVKIYYTFHFIVMQYFLYCIVSLEATGHQLAEN
jgi:hypothetical protein